MNVVVFSIKKFIQITDHLADIVFVRITLFSFKLFFGHTSGASLLLPEPSVIDRLHHHR